MKKFLLSALCAVAALAGSAAEFTYTHNFAKGDLKSGATSAQLDGVEWTFGAVGSWDGNTQKGYQIGTAKAPVAKWTMSSTAFANATITSVTVKAATAKDGEASLAVTVGGQAFGSSSEVYGATLSDITVSGSAKGNIEITLNNAKEKAMYISAVTVKYTADAEIGGGNAGGETPGTPDTPETPDPVETVGQGTEASPYTVADVIALNNPTPAKEAWVKGYIIGCYNYVDGTGNVLSATELTTATNIAIAATTTGYEGKVIAVQLKTGSAPCAALNLKDNPGNLGKEVAVYGSLEKYIVNQGVKNCSAYALDGQTPETPDPIETVGKGTEASPYTVADVIALNNPGTKSQWVKGYIVGDLKTQNGYKCETAAPFSSNTNLYIAGTATETDSLKMVLVQLPNNDIRTALNLKDNPGNLGKELLIKGDLESYSRQFGVKNPTEYKLDGQGSTPEAPTAPAEGPGSEFEPLTIAEAIAKDNDKSYNWVTGYIIGTCTSDSIGFNEETKKPIYGPVLHTSDFLATNLVIAPTANETDMTKCMPVELPEGDIRAALNLKDRPGNLGKEVTVLGQLVKYFSVNGVKGTSQYRIAGGVAPIVVDSIATLSDFIEEQPKTNVAIKEAVTVFFQYKRYTFITNGTDNIEVYGELPHTYENGDVLTGITGSFSTYKDMPQFTPVAESFGEAVKGTAVEPVEKTLDKVRPADYVVVSNVDIVADGNNWNVTDGTTTYQLFNRFDLPEITETKGTTILGIGAIYDGKNQLFPITIGYTNSISEINAAKPAARGIFDLQGRRLSAPVKGINIINGRKVLVK